MELNRFSSAIESILFAADRPLSIARVKEVFGEEGPSEEEIKGLISEIKQKYTDPQFGFELREALGGYQFCTKPENAEWVRCYFQTKPFRLGRSALETLAIIAYRQPITRAEIDQVRGIDSSHLLRVLMERGLVKMAGKAEVPGRPVQYGTTPKFLEVVGLTSLGELPPLSELEKLEGHTEETQLPSLEEGLDRIMADVDTEVEESSSKDKSMLTEIETLLESAQGAGKEVYESRDHAEVAQENEVAVREWQAFSRQMGRQQSRRERAHTPTQLNLMEVPVPQEQTQQAGTELGEGEPIVEEKEEKLPSIKDIISGDVLPGPPNPGSETPEPLLN